MPQCGQRVVVLRVLRIPENRRLHRLGCLLLKVPSAYPSSRHEIDAREHACQETRAGSNTSPRSTPVRDRKSTRLNSSHMSISYAVFCLKKKNMDQSQPVRARGLPGCCSEILSISRLKQR